MTGPTLVVAADGGNSKTDLVLASADGEVLARLTGEGTRPYVDGLETTAARLADLARSALVRAGLAADTRVAVASWYLANVDIPDEELSMHAALTALGVADHIEVSNDAFAVLRAGSPRGWGIAVVSGAGINAVGIHADGRRERFLGIGPWSGDWGGGLGLVQSAIGAAVRAGDGRGPATLLRASIENHFGADVETVAIDAHARRIGYRALTGFAPAVFAAARAGDAVALALVERQAEEVGAFIAALVARMGLASAGFDVVLGGSVLQADDPLLTSRIRERVSKLAPGAVLRVLDAPPVCGALASALALAGAAPQAAARARDALRLGG